jgi:hypothetical protein
LATAFVAAGVMHVVVLTEERDVLDEIQDPDRQISRFWMRLWAFVSVSFVPYITGIFWNIATPSPYSNIILDTQRSIVTFLIITITLPLYWTALDLNMLITFMTNLPHISIIANLPEKATNV